MDFDNSSLYCRDVIQASGGSKLKKVVRYMKEREKEEIKSPTASLLGQQWTCGCNYNIWSSTVKIIFKNSDQIMDIINDNGAGRNVQY